MTEPSPYRFVGMSPAHVADRMPDGATIEGIGGTVDEAAADAHRNWMRGPVVTDRLPMLREAVVRAEAHHAGLLGLRHALGSTVGAAPMDAADAVWQLVRRLRFEVEELEEEQRLVEELRELGIDPDELEDEPGPGILAFDMVLPRPARVPPNPCYRTASGTPVHARPGCRC